jgi:hypothetical protein
MLRDQEKSPIIDAWHLNQYGEVVQSFSLPLLPIVPIEDEEVFTECLEMLKEWYQDLAHFLEERRR